MYIYIYIHIHIYAFSHFEVAWLQPEMFQGATKPCKQATQAGVDGHEAFACKKQKPHAEFTKRACTPNKDLMGRAKKLKVVPRPTVRSGAAKVVL